MPEPKVDSLPDLAGDPIGTVLDRLHRELKPKSYLEIGTQAGDSLRFARCASIAVDPNFELVSAEPVSGKPLCALYCMSSDDFFASVDPSVVLGRRVDFAFIDGMHLAEFALRDFMNTERYCRRNSIIALHDCLPLDFVMAQRCFPTEDEAMDTHRFGWWTGDVWRFALLLKQRRQDLRLTMLDAFPTGLLLATNLDPGSTMLVENYAAFVEEMQNMSLRDITLSGLHTKLGVESTSVLASSQQIYERFWL